MSPYPAVQLASAAFADQFADQIAALSNLTIAEGSFTSEWVIETLQDPEMTAAVAMSGETVLAVGVMGAEEDIAFLQVVAVHPEHRRQRLGAAMVDWMESHAAAAGATESFTQVLSSDEPALGLFLGRGYTRMELHRVGATDGEHGVMLRKKLVQPAGA